jgi:dissimilatory sulfite reductase (desulfoviridin) alpha/beta subunit
LTPLTPLDPLDSFEPPEPKDPEADTLELALSPSEEEEASLEMAASHQSQDSTQTLTEAPLPAGANIASHGTAALEPRVVDAPESARPEDFALPPAFWGRLSPATADGQATVKLEVKKEGPLTWSLALGDAWPVFVRRHLLPRPAESIKLKEISRAARRYGAGRLCLSPQGDLDIFFNDRKSLERAEAELKTASPDLRGAPASITACRGLILCPHASFNSLGAKDSLTRVLKERGLKSSKPSLQIAIHGCPAGGGLNCGVYERADLRVVGRRDFIPLIDQEILALSPNLGRVIDGCPAGALKESAKPRHSLEIDPNLCARCGYCLALDPSFRLPQPQGGYFSLEVAGRRQSGERSFVRPWTLIPRVSLSERDNIFAEIADLIEMWLREARDGEILADFMDRAHLHDFFNASPNRPQSASPSP